MREINELIWHCTATPEGREVSAAEIDKWHKARGWKGIGYHKLVHLDGAVSDGRPESEEGAHVKGRNRNTIGYAYVGGIMNDGSQRAKDTRTDAQKATMARLTMEAIARYDLEKVSGHRQHAAKACPSFDAKAEYAPLLEEGYTPPPPPDIEPTGPTPPTFKRPSLVRAGIEILLIAAALVGGFFFVRNFDEVTKWLSSLF